MKKEDLKKCLRIEIGRETNTDDISKIVKYCKKLSEINFISLDGFDRKNLKKLLKNNKKTTVLKFRDCKNFGPKTFKKLKYVKKSLEELDLSGYDLNVGDFTDIMQLKLENLSKLVIGPNYELSEAFKAHFSNCLLQSQSRYKLVLNSDGESIVEDDRKNKVEQKNLKYRWDFSKDQKKIWRSMKTVMYSNDEPSLRQHSTSSIASTLTTVLSSDSGSENKTENRKHTYISL